MKFGVLLTRDLSVGLLVRTGQVLVKLGNVGGVDTDSGRLRLLRSLPPMCGGEGVVSSIGMSFPPLMSSLGEVVQNKAHVCPCVGPEAQQRGAEPPCVSPAPGHGGAGGSPAGPQGSKGGDLVCDFHTSPGLTCQPCP